MTQEDHWKKAYNDLHAKYTAEGTDRDERYRKLYNDLEKQYKDQISDLTQRLEKARTVIDGCELVLNFTHDDIRSSLAEDTVTRIEGALDSVRLHHGLKRRFK